MQERTANQLEAKENEAKQLKIGIIIPVYEIPAHMLRECFASLQRQTYKNIEVVFVDDASPDACGQICDEFATVDSRVTVIHKEHNEGVSAARNTGIDYIACDYLTFVDGDDWVDDNLFHDLMEAVSTYDSLPDIVIFQQAMAYLNQNLFTTPYPLEHIWDIPEKRESLQIMAISPALKGTYARVPAIDNVAGKLISCDLLKKTGIRFRRIPYREDGVFFQEIVEEANCVVEVPTGYYYYRMRKGSAVNQFRKNAPSEMLELCKLMFDFAERRKKSKAYWHALYSFLLIPIQMSIVCYFYHPENKMNFIKKYIQCRLYLKQKPYREFFQNVSLRQLNRNNWIKAVLLKFNCYGAIAWLRRLYFEKQEFIPYE